MGNKGNTGNKGNKGNMGNKGIVSLNLLIPLYFYTHIPPCVFKAVLN